MYAVIGSEELARRFLKCLRGDWCADVPRTRTAREILYSALPENDVTE